MASIFRRSKKKNSPYTIQYSDHEGKRQTVIGFTDKGLTEQLAARLETESRLRRTGLVDVAQEKLLETKLAPIEPLLDAFEFSLSDNSKKYVKLLMSRVRRIIIGCKIEKIADIECEKIQSFLRTERKSKQFGNRTYNHYLQAIDSFCNWCVSTKRMLSNPIAGLERLNIEIDVRHKRRALTPDEIVALVNSARNSVEVIQCFNGEQRGRIYLIAYMTGLRRNEIASLTPRSFALNDTPPTVTIEAKDSKHKKRDILPLHPDLVVMVRQWVNGMKPGEFLFPKLAGRRTWLMVKKDLERVGIAYENETGIADFHAAGRHTHITELLRNGVSLPEAQKLARHSDIKMTMKYTHIGIADQAKAVANLPSPALHWRCISGVSEGHLVSSGGNGRQKRKRRNPVGDSGFGVDRHLVTNPGKVEAAGIACLPIEILRKCLYSNSLQRMQCGSIGLWRGAIRSFSPAIRSKSEASQFRAAYRTAEITDRGSTGAIENEPYPRSRNTPTPLQQTTITHCRTYVYALHRFCGESVRFPPCKADFATHLEVLTIFVIPAPPPTGALVQFPPRHSASIAVA